MTPTVLDHVQSDFTTVYYLNNMSSLQLFPHPKPGSSHCWKHFHLQKDTSGNFDKTCVFCIHCKTRLSYNNNTTSMSAHLNQKHGITALITLAQE